MHSEISWDEFPYPSRRVPVFARIADSVHLQIEYDVVFESGFDPVVQQSLRERGHRPGNTTPMFAFGGAQLASRPDNGFYGAASDHRKDGRAAGY